ncbi:complement factor B [Amia ocellicauda]|uniref:complement factor B n=1 Tax=Amia ocellicauda TaxID=2972642 RepID=UPI00346420F4
MYIAVVVILILFCNNSVRSDVLCDEAVEIQGGTVEFLGGRAVGSVLQYVCPPNSRAQPVSWRVCQSSGSWSPLRYPRMASCVPYQCSGPITLENGWFSPRKALYNIGDTVQFQCRGGFMLFGSPNRTCLPTGKWSGQTTVCDTGNSLCRNPGVPLGGQRVGQRFEQGDRVRYTCYRGLVLRGSAFRTCLEDGSWSGPEPLCEGQYSYDEPETLTKHLAFSEEVLLHPDKELHIYFVVKASSSVGTENLLKAFDFVQNVSGKVMEFSGKVKCSVVAFASSAQELTPLTADAMPLEEVGSTNYTDLLNQSGVNTGEALRFVLQSIHHNVKSTVPPKNIIIILTDGRHNMGPSPYSIIRNMTETIPEPEKNLDIFTIGVGGASKEELDQLASQRAEQRAFYLPDYTSLANLSTEEPLESCGIRGGQVRRGHGRVYKGIKANDKQWPWQVLLRIQGEDSGGGSIISKQWILTAAHVLICYKSKEVVCEPNEVEVFAGIADRSQIGKPLEVEKVFVHEEYRNNGTFYYDIGLLKLKREIQFDGRHRPVCLPCTAPLSRVLSLPDLDWHVQCEFQDLLLTGHGGEDYRPVNGIITGWGKTKNYQGTLAKNLHYGSISIQQREECSKVRIPIPFTAEKFCAKGDNVDACAGDSGGPFVIKKNGRWIQIGIVSYGQEKCAAESMGFYASVPRMMQWIRGKVGEDI